MDFFKWRTRASRKPPGGQPTELRIATSGSFSIRATIESLKVDGAGRVRAALFVPSTVTTVQFHGDISIGWSDRGVSLPTQDVLVQTLSKETQDLVHKAIREQLLPFARRQYPHLNAAFDKQPYPRPGNLFIVRYSASCQRPGGRGLKLHKDETALTFNVCLSPQDGFEGGGTYFPAASGDVDGIVLRPTPGYSLVHDGNIKHAGNEVLSGDRFILVGFYNADGRDRAGEEVYFNKRALEEARQRLIRQPPAPTQTIYFTTAVAAARGGAGGAAVSSTQNSWFLPPVADGDDHWLRPHCIDTNGSDLKDPSPHLPPPPRNLSSVAIQGPITGAVPGPPTVGVTPTSDESCRMRGGETMRGEAGPSSSPYLDESLDGPPSPPSVLPPMRPGSPARPATPTDSVTSLLSGTPSRGNTNDSSISGHHGLGSGHGSSGSLHSMSGGGHNSMGRSSGGTVSCSTTSCLPNWPVLSLLMPSKSRAASRR